MRRLLLRIWLRARRTEYLSCNMSQAWRELAATGCLSEEGFLYSSVCFFHRAPLMTAFAVRCAEGGP